MGVFLLMHLLAGTAQAIIVAALLVYSWIQSFGKFNDPAILEHPF
jgi:hypothetical protein